MGRGSALRSRRSCALSCLRRLYWHCRSPRASHLRSHRKNPFRSSFPSRRERPPTALRASSPTSSVRGCVVRSWSSTGPVPAARSACRCWRRLRPTATRWVWAQPERCCSTPIYLAIPAPTCCASLPLFDPDQIAIMTTAFEQVLLDLKLTDRDDPLVKMIAKLVIELMRNGARDPEQVRKAVVASTGASSPSTRVST